MIALPMEASNAQVALMASVQTHAAAGRTPSAWTVTTTAETFLTWLNDQDKK